MNRRSLFVAATAAALAPFTLAYSSKAGTLHQDGAEWFTNVAVNSHDGRTFRFYDDLLKGKIILVNFFYTDCDEVCPLVTQNLSAVQDLLGSRVGQDIFMYSISLRPQRDTPERLAAYAKAHGVGPGWLLLTGKPDDVDLLRHRLGFVDSDPAQDADPEQHLGTVRIANEPLHRWTMSPGLLNPAAIIRAVKRTIPEPA
jgi:protein SCO1